MPLLVAATPIGNVADATPRLRDALATADVVAAEDTRRLRALAARLSVGIGGRVVSYYDAVEQERTVSLLEALRLGRTVLLVTDAGTPLVSDPGYRLLVAAVDAGIEVHALPGPSAATTALVLSALPADRWCVEGFLPRRTGERRSRLEAIADDPRTTVFFEAPHRLASMLRDAATAFGPSRRAAVCRELTKTHEEVRRGTLEELVAWAEEGVRGEVTVVVAGAGEPPAVEEATLRRELAELLASGMSKRDAAAEVARRHAISKRAVYALASSL